MNHALPRSRHRGLALLAAGLMTAALLTACTNDQDDDCDYDSQGTALLVEPAAVIAAPGKPGPRPGTKSRTTRRSGTRNSVSKPKATKQKPPKPSKTKAHKPHKAHHDFDDCND